MRYDLVVNTMVKSALTTGRILIHNPGLWRPIIDVRDAARAYVRAVEAPLAISGTFNIALANFSVGRIAWEVASVLADHGIQVSLQVEHRQDPRSYRVSTRRAREVLGFEGRVSLPQSVSDLLWCIQRGLNCDFDNPRYINIEWIKQAAPSAYSLPV